jgi:hypothetical protein
MPKPFPKTETEIVMSVDRDAGVLDLRVFATQHKRQRSSALQRLGSDVPEVVRLLTEGLRGEELLIEAETTAKKSKKRKAAKS